VQCRAFNRGAAAAVDGDAIYGGQAQLQHAHERLQDSKPTMPAATVKGHSGYPSISGCVFVLLQHADTSKLSCLMCSFYCRVALWLTSCAISTLRACQRW
jgi:hypothetical protein